MLLNIYSSGTIITDLNGVILDFNSIAESILKNSQLRGKNIRIYLENMNCGKLYVTECQHCKIYMMKINENYRFKKHKKKNKCFGTRNTANSVEFRSEKIKKLSASVEKLSTKDVNLLLLGESGTGKTFLANKIHNLSLRKNKPFVTINCTTIPEELIESELFGYEKGSFTGASLNGKEGLVEQANMGTLFLDEIGELAPTVQAKLLQLVEEKTYIPIGSVYPRKVDIRIIAATNRNLIQLVRNGVFRQDLYYRLALGVIKIPPLRERKEDINILLNYYLNLFNKKYDTRIELSEYSRKMLNNYSWPGNIRELENSLEVLVINAPFTNYIISKKDLPENITGLSRAELVDKNTAIVNRLDPKLRQVFDLNKNINNYKAGIVRKAKKIYKSSYKVARYLNISQSTASRLISKYCK
ncbi:sigma-54-dependent Fis family transcriptional regulator [uncultured Clostridium sp.]|uniref:sigma-54 interaction domain-containing protein n=1 Tax=uncultured Clostridium sp. TaxID=59620 RepID=UPI0025CE8469|nr:sigma 54-interacting transcriptional regulator [uncultured Clostridium sp.]